jgi:hypothetical protein
VSFAPLCEKSPIQSQLLNLFSSPVPYKAGDYLSYDLPLLSTLPGELSELIEHYECGQTYTAGDPESATPSHPSLP